MASPRRKIYKIFPIDEEGNLRILAENGSKIEAIISINQLLLRLIIVNNRTIFGLKDMFGRQEKRP